MFNHILLQPEQEELLVVLVEAARNTQGKHRQKFEFIQSMGGNLIHHPGLGGQIDDAYLGDIETLGREGLLALTYGSKGTLQFDVTPFGFKFYEHLKLKLGQPFQRVEASVRSYLDTEAFQRKYPSAYQKWAEAEQVLWSSDSDKQLTTIGHLCREAVQEFASALVDRYQPLNVTDSPTSTVDRIRAVLDLRSESIGATVKPLMKTLLAYWGTVNDLIQRQEHGGQKEGRSLVWEDGRRVVFTTALVMYEIDHALS